MESEMIKMAGNEKIVEKAIDDAYENESCARKLVMVAFVMDQESRIFFRILCWLGCHTSTISVPNEKHSGYATVCMKEKNSSSDCRENYPGGASTDPIAKGKSQLRLGMLLGDHSRDKILIDKI